MVCMAKEDYTLSYEYIKINTRKQIIFALIRDLEILAKRIRSEIDKKEFGDDIYNLIEMLKLSVKMGKF